MIFRPFPLRGVRPRCTTARAALTAATVFFSASIGAASGSESQDDTHGWIRMAGEFVFDDGGAARPEPISASFRRIGPDLWEARFDFPFNGQQHRWTGHFTGDPVAGVFRGEVTWPNGRRSRTWIVEGQTGAGRLEARHVERR